MTFQKLDTIFQHTAKHGIKHQAATALAIEHVQEFFTLFFGPDALADMKPVSIRRSVLTIAVSSGAAAAAVGSVQEETLAYVNKKVGYRMVEKIRVIS